MIDQERIHHQCFSDDPDERLEALKKIIANFSSLPDKQQAWNDLIRLTNDEDSDVREWAAHALDSAFSYVPDKQQAWNDLIRLTSDEESYVRVYANYSLGKVSIFRASQAEKEEDYKRKLEKAIEFFEIAANESPKWWNPAQFCLPFYRSFHTIVFKNMESKEEIDKYLEEAEKAIKGSKNRELLFEAIENLANALKEVQNLENLDLEAKKGELNFYRKYCDHAAELMKNANEKAPFAVEVLRKGLPILDKNLKELLEVIQEKAKIACQKSKGTNTEEIACAVSKEVQKWEVDNQEVMTQKVESLITMLKLEVPQSPENCIIIDEIEKIREETNIEKQYEIISRIIPIIPHLYMQKKLEEINSESSDTTKEIGKGNDLQKKKEQFTMRLKHFLAPIVFTMLILNYFINAFQEAANTHVNKSLLFLSFLLLVAILIANTSGRD